MLKQQWTIEEMSIFSNSSHLEWRMGLSDTIFKGTHPRTIPARFGLIRLRGLSGEDLNVKVYGRTDGRTDGSVTISLRNFVGEGIITCINVYNIRKSGMCEWSK